MIILQWFKSNDINQTTLYAMLSDGYVIMWVMIYDCISDHIYIYVRCAIHVYVLNVI